MRARGDAETQRTPRLQHPFKPSASALATEVSENTEKRVGRAEHAAPQPCGRILTQSHEE